MRFQIRTKYASGRWVLRMYVEHASLYTTRYQVQFCGNYVWIMVSLQALPFEYHPFDTVYFKIIRLELLSWNQTFFSSSESLFSLSESELCSESELELSSVLAAAAADMTAVELAAALPSKATVVRSSPAAAEASGSCNKIS